MQRLSAFSSAPHPQPIPKGVWEYVTCHSHVPTTGHKSTACVTCWEPPRRGHTARAGWAAPGQPAALTPCLCVTVLPVNLPASTCISICFYFYALNFSLVKALISLLLLVPCLGFFFIRLPESASHFFSFEALCSHFQRRILLVCCRTWASEGSQGPLRPPCPPAPRGLPRLPAPTGLGIHLLSPAPGPWHVVA